MDNIYSNCASDPEVIAAAMRKYGPKFEMDTDFYYVADHGAVSSSLEFPDKGFFLPSGVEICGLISARKSGTPEEIIKTMNEVIQKREVLSRKGYAGTFVEKDEEWVDLEFRPKVFSVKDLERVVSDFNF